jgi:hypothetical protein
MHMLAGTEAAVDLVSLAVTRSGTLQQRGGGFQAAPIRVVLILCSRAVVRCCDRHGRLRLNRGNAPSCTRCFSTFGPRQGGCGFSATGILKNIAVSRHAANFLAAATINLNMPPGFGGDSPMKGSGGGGYARAF